MRRVVGMDIHRTFAEVVFWEAGRLRPAGRVDMTKAGLEGFGRTLSKQDEVVVEATGCAMAVVRALGLMAEYDTAHGEHLGQVAQAQLVAQAPEHHERDDVGRILRPIQHRAGAFVELLAAGPATGSAGSPVP